MSAGSIVQAWIFLQVSAFLGNGKLWQVQLRTETKFAPSTCATIADSVMGECMFPQQKVNRFRLSLPPQGKELRVKERLNKHWSTEA